jgi:drug/metabolite transporter (DMT)-like permease
LGVLKVGDFGEISAFDWWPSFSNDEWVRLTLSGVFGVAIGDYLFVSALKRLGAGFLAIVDCLYAPTAMVVAFVLFGEVVPGLVLLGGALVVSAVFISSSEEAKVKAGRSNLLIGVLQAFLSLLVMIVAALVVRDIYRDYSVMWVVGYRFTISAVVLLIWFAIRGWIGEVWNIWRAKELKYLLLGSFLGPFLASFLWFMGFKYALAGKAAILNQLSTVFIFLLGAWVLKEPLTPKRVLAIVLAFFGAVLVGISG